MKILLLITVTIFAYSCVLTGGSSKKKKTSIKTNTIKNDKKVTKQTTQTKSIKTYKEGEYRDFKLMNTKNKFRSLDKILKESNNNFVVLAFFAPNCIDGKEKRKKLHELSKKLKFNLVYVVSNFNSLDNKTFVSKAKEIFKEDSLETLMDTKMLSARIYKLNKNNQMNIFVINKNTKKMSKKINTTKDKLETFIKQNLK